MIVAGVKVSSLRQLAENDKKILLPAIKRILHQDHASVMNQAVKICSQTGEACTGASLTVLFI